MYIFFLYSRYSRSTLAKTPCIDTYKITNTHAADETTLCKLQNPLKCQLIKSDIYR